MELSLLGMFCRVSENGLINATEDTLESDFTDLHDASLRSLIDAAHQRLHGCLDHCGL